MVNILTFPVNHMKIISLFYFSYIFLFRFLIIEGLISSARRRNQEEESKMTVRWVFEDIFGDKLKESDPEVQRFQLNGNYIQEVFFEIFCEYFVLFCETSLK